ncbi:helix-turn-helix domain-containing protein [Pusillimonas noertemannii]|uniref:AraC-like DNA-binding protein n=1 Tax=Pusillimonas noertemannii TaxID=305977 RepID=A0A2U1CPE1_9BURK|nr:helix-turn-helix domain-containing protein [Pusillimonas noertemannii]NYT67008.1 helix-turn-helix domain-containing protein [Pusillimonas noertemannii]PVY67681.1 AraC-like DNA-binding protein [Pusillimonas noertemannii]TFL12781.1 helix-turn-helix domain-containing protein [Pusillimonas noertemannii]
MLNKFTFSSQETPWADTCQVFENKMEKLFAVNFNYRAVDTRPLHGNITTYNGPSLSLSSLEFTPHIASCSESAPTPSTAVFVSVQKQGETHLKQADRECVTQPGDIFIFDPSSPFRLESSTTHVYSMYVPRRALLEHVPHVSKLTATRIDGKAGAAALLRVMLDELFSLAPSLKPQALPPLSSIFPQLVSTVLLSQEQFDGVGPSRMNAFHKSKILSFIQANLHDPSLNATSIAQGVGLSTRYVYQLFEDESMSLMKWVWAQRLEQCRRQIMSPVLRNKSISEIAYDWGFSDTAHFSRVFKAAYKQTPRECRATMPG